MPKISDIEETPNPNAVKFILREAVSNGTTHQYASADQAENDSLAKSLFEVGHVVSVFYMDRMITVEKDDEGDWDDLLPILAVPIRAAAAVNSPAAAAAAVGGAIAAVTSDDPRLLKINDILDEKVRPALMGDGGYLEVLGLKDHTLSIRYQGACGSCPSSLTGTLMKMPDATVLCPGHNYADKPLTTMGEQKKHNPYLMCDSLDNFLKFRTGVSERI